MDDQPSPGFPHKRHYSLVEVDQIAAAKIQLEKERDICLAEFPVEPFHRMIRQTEILNAFPFKFQIGQHASTSFNETVPAFMYIFPRPGKEKRKGTKMELRTYHLGRNILSGPWNLEDYVRLDLLSPSKQLTLKTVVALRSIVKIYFQWADYANILDRHGLQFTISSTPEDDSD
jgi:hypothetical protein